MPQKTKDINDINPADYNDPVELARDIKKLMHTDFLEQYSSLKKSMKAKSH